MHVFGMNEDEFTHTMKSFMVELDYNPEDKDDVALFYTQENPSDLYDVYLARKVKTIGKYMNVFGINPEYYDDILEFIQLVKEYILSDKNLASKYNMNIEDFHLNIETRVHRIRYYDNDWVFDKNVKATKPAVKKVPDILAFFLKENVDDVYMNIKLTKLSINNNFCNK
jgi:hypothetical protein